jgi:hypothetical protein
MSRLLLLILPLLLALGCATDGEKSQWDEVLKDLRGDNMEMRSGWGANRAAYAKTSE